MEQGDLIERKSDELAAVLAQGNRELQKMFRYLIREAIRNVPEHAGTNEVWICGQYWHNRDKAEIAILDEGIGVYESLKQNRIHREYVTNNEEALRWAPDTFKSNQHIGRAAVPPALRGGGRNSQATI